MMDVFQTPEDAMNAFLDRRTNTPCHRHPGCDCFIECAVATDAEVLQVEDDQPGVSVRFGVSLLLLVAGLVGTHAVWAANGMVGL